MIRKLILFLGCSYSLYAVSAFLFLLFFRSFSGNTELPWQLLLVTAILPACFYLFRGYRIALHAGENSDEKISWYKKNLTSIRLVLLFFSAFIPLSTVQLFFVDTPTTGMMGFVAALLLPGMLTFLYYPNPVFTSGLRSYGIAKPLCLSLTWALFCSAPPVLAAYSLQNNMNELVPGFASLFFLFGGLAILSDIKDIQTDSRNMVRTIPVRWGNFNAIAFAVIPCFVLSAVCDFFIFSHATSVYGIMATAVFLFVCTAVALKTPGQKNPIFFLLCVDGLMLLKALDWLLIS